MCDTYIICILFNAHRQEIVTKLKAFANRFLGVVGEQLQRSLHSYYLMYDCVILINMNSNVNFGIALRTQTNQILTASQLESVELIRIQKKTQHLT